MRYFTLFPLILSVWAALPPTTWRTAPFSGIPLLNTVYGSVACDEGGHMIYYTSLCTLAGLSCTVYRWNTTGSATLLNSQTHTFALAILNPTLSTLSDTLIFSYDVLIPPTSYVLTLYKSNLTQKSLVLVSTRRMGVYLISHDIFVYHEQD